MHATISNMLTEMFIKEDIRRSMRALPNRSYVVLVNNKKESDSIEEEVTKEFDGFLRRVCDMGKRTRIIDLVTATRLRIIVVDTAEKLNMDLCGVSINKWWSLLDNLTKDIVFEMKVRTL